MKKVRNTLFSLLILASVVCACQDEKEPQPDWASKFVGTYAPDNTQWGDVYAAISGTQQYNITGVYQINRVDNATVNLKVALVPFVMKYQGQYKTFSPTIKHEFKNVRVVKENTLFVDEVLRDNAGKTILQLDSVRFEIYPRDSTVFLGIRFKQIYDVDVTVGMRQNKLLYKDTPFKAYWVQHTYNKFELHQRYFIPTVDAIEYSWDFGDGATSTDEHAYHEYQKNGYYRVTLKVKDKDGKEATSSGGILIDNLPY